MIKYSSFDSTISALDAEMSALGGAMSAIARRSFNATISALDAETSAIVRNYRRYRLGVIGDCGVGVTPQMCNRAIVEETLTSGKYVLLFLISILNIYKIKKIT